MPRMDWTPTGGSDFEPGIYLARIVKCEARTSRKGDAMLSLRWHADDFEAGELFLCFDIVMMSGNGRGIGQAKLNALGFNENDDEIQPEQLLGRRAWLSVDWQDYTNAQGENRRSLKVVSRFEPAFTCGYWAESEPPKNATSPVADDPFSQPAPTPSAAAPSATDDSVPF